MAAKLSFYARHFYVPLMFWLVAIVGFLVFIINPVDFGGFWRVLCIPVAGLSCAYASVYSAAAFGSPLLLKKLVLLQYDFVRGHRVLSRVLCVCKLSLLAELAAISEDIGREKRAIRLFRFLDSRMQSGRPPLQWIFIATVLKSYAHLLARSGKAAEALACLNRIGFAPAYSASLGAALCSSLTGVISILLLTLSPAGNLYAMQASYLALAASVFVLTCAGVFLILLTFAEPILKIFGRFLRLRAFIASGRSLIANCLLVPSIAFSIWLIPDIMNFSAWASSFKTASGFEELALYCRTFEVDAERIKKYIDTVNDADIEPTKKYALEIDLADSGLKHDKNALDLLCWRGFAYEELGYPEKNLADHNLGIAKEPDNWKWYAERARIYLRMHKQADAIVDARKCAALSPSDPEAVDVLTEIYNELDMKEDALAASSDAIACVRKKLCQSSNKKLDGEMASSLVSIFSNRAKALLANGDSNGAIQAIDSALIACASSKDGFQPLMILRAKVYKQNKQYELALADLSQVLKVDTECKDAYLARAEIYDKLGRHDLALADLGKVN